MEHYIHIPWDRNVVVQRISSTLTYYSLHRLDDGLGLTPIQANCECSKGNDPTSITFHQRGFDPKIPAKEPKMFVYKNPITSDCFFRFHDLCILEHRTCQTGWRFLQKFDFEFEFNIVPAEQRARIPSTNREWFLFALNCRREQTKIYILMLFTRADNMT